MTFDHTIHDADASAQSPGGVALGPVTKTMRPGAPGALAPPGTGLGSSREPRARVLSWVIGRALLVACLAGVALVATVPAAGASAGGFRLDPNESLTANQFLRSPNGQYTLYMQGDGNLVLYAAGSRALWSTSTYNNPGARVTMQGNGNLVLYSASGFVLWYSNTPAHPGAFLNIQDDANLVIYSPSLQPLWYTGTINSSLLRGESLSASQYLLSPNRQTKLLMQGNGNLVLLRGSQIAWQSGTHNNPGARVTLQSGGNLVVLSASGAILWQSLTDGIPGTSLYVLNEGRAVLYGRPGQASQWGEVWAAPF